MVVPPKARIPSAKFELGTAVELDPELARLYQERFPNDIVIIEDAHQYLLDHYKEFNFIWTSPPCPSHSRARYWNASNYDTTTEPIYPDMTLYQEILFLKHWYKTGKFVVDLREEKIKISKQQLEWLMLGVDWKILNKKVIKYDNYC